jgi:hypothetical protein
MSEINTGIVDSSPLVNNHAESKNRDQSDSTTNSEISATIPPRKPFIKRLLSGIYDLMMDDPSRSRDKAAGNYLKGNYHGYPYVAAKDLDPSKIEAKTVDLEQKK